MSQSTRVKREVEPEREIRKSIQVVGYVKERVGPRMWADLFYADTDYYETKETEKVRYYLKSSDTEIELSEGEYEELSEAFIGELGVVKDVEIEEKYAHEPSRASERLKNEIMSEVVGVDGPLPWVDPTNWKLVRTGKDRWDSDTLCYLYESCGEIPMLKDHVRGSVDEEDLYVDEEEEYTVVKYRFKIQDCDEETADVITDQIIRPFVSALGRHEEIRTVRWLDCETKTTEKGACFVV